MIPGAAVALEPAADGFHGPIPRPPVGPSPGVHRPVSLLSTALLSAVRRLTAPPVCPPSARRARRRCRAAISFGIRRTARLSSAWWTPVAGVRPSHLLAGRLAGLGPRPRERHRRPAEPRSWTARLRSGGGSLPLLARPVRPRQPLGSGRPAWVPRPVAGDRHSMDPTCGTSRYRTGPDPPRRGAAGGIAAGRACRHATGASEPACVSNRAGRSDAPRTLKRSADAAARYRPTPLGSGWGCRSPREDGYCRRVKPLRRPWTS